MMEFIVLLGYAVGLSMDAFAVSVCKGLAMQKVNARQMAIVGLWFGGFQALMPLIGYFVGSSFAGYIESFDHWVAFALLLLIGGNMIRESFSKDEDRQDASLGFVQMLILAVATSIDALAVGIAFALDNSFAFSIWTDIAVIGVTTFAISAAGIRIGSIFGTKYKSKAEFIGGAILIAIGLKILIEGLLT